MMKTKKVFSKKRTTIALLIILASVILSSEQFLGSIQLAGAADPNQEIDLSLEPRDAIASPASNIYVAEGREYAHISDLVNLMGSHDLLFYKSETTGVNQGPDGLIAHEDLVLIKINCQWNQRGGTNTDLLKELIQMIVDHPDGFVGEIVVADNGQAQHGSFGTGGSLNWASNNAEDQSQSAQDVVDMFSASYDVSTYLWDTITELPSVGEYSEDDMNDGYIVDQTPYPVTGIQVSYPKFRTDFGTYISFKEGIWNPVTESYDSEKLKVINFPILKSHGTYGVTASIKHYMGVVSAKQTNAHNKVGTGGMGTVMVETRFPTLNILDAIYVNANPAPADHYGPPTSYWSATRVNTVMASTDPVALAYWGSKNVLMQAANLIGHTDTHTINPDSTDKSGLWGEAFGVWLELAKTEIVAGGYSVTTDENRMNVYVTSEGSPPGEETFPEIGTPSQDPPRYNVMAGEEVKVSVNVTDAGSGVKNVTLSYALNNGTAWENQTMNYNPSTSLYEATISGQPADTWVEFKIVAYNNAENCSTKESEPYCTYQVIPEFQSGHILLVLLVIITLMVIVYRRKHYLRTLKK
ncbi:MAG: DUF362 domain-containing protein [Candidatus Bathyarchaeum sp.]|nr:MAG: DUF362 domain-containing protein [Candidatus Bathyarchaeum sp.]